MNIIQVIPVVRLLLPLLLGIIFYLNSSFNFAWVKFFLPFLFIFFLGFSVRLNSHWNSRFIAGLLLNILLFFSGVALTHFRDLSADENHFRHYSVNGETFALASIEDGPKTSAKTNKITLIIRKIIPPHDHEKKVKGKILAYLSKEIATDKLIPGRVLLIRFHPEEIMGPRNPGEFNYKRYLSFHGVYHQQYFTKNDLVFINLPNTQKLKSIAWELRRKVLNILKGITDNHEDFGVLAALVTGHEEDLTSETLRAYSATGALHVLSVSGMHVGIIFLLLNLLLKHLEKIKNGKLLRLFLSIFILWFYALFTGLSPSVLRACTMFTFLQSGKFYQKTPNSLNTLLSSGLVLLLINPFLATEVGFQLSFCAVGGIIIFYKKIHGMLSPSNWILKQAWSITAVSLAAQLTTFPMGLLYFHQFPNYFLLSNLIIIPLTTIILYAGMLYIMVSPLPWLKIIIGSMSEFLLATLRKIVTAFETLPFAQISGVDFSIFETLIIYAIITFFSFFLVQKKSVNLFVTLTGLFLFSGLETYKMIQQKKASLIAIYSTGKYNSIGFIHQQKIIFLSDPDFLNNENAQRFHCSNHWAQLGINKKNYFDLSKSGIIDAEAKFIKSENIVLFNGKTILINPEFHSASSNPKIDLVILTNKFIPPVSLKKMARDLGNCVFIIGANIPKNTAKNWKKIFEEAGVKQHSIQNDGFYGMEIN